MNDVTIYFRRYNNSTDIGTWIVNYNDINVIKQDKGGSYTIEFKNMPVISITISNEHEGIEFSDKKFIIDKSKFLDINAINISLYNEKIKNAIDNL